MTDSDDVEAGVAAARATYFHVVALQKSLAAVGLSRIEISATGIPGAGGEATLTGVVPTARERDLALQVATNAGWKPIAALSIDEVGDAELAGLLEESRALVRAAYQTEDPGRSAPMAEAESTLERAITIADARHAGTSSPFRLRLRFELERLLRGHLAYPQAVRVCRAALAAAEAMFGKDDPRTAEAIYTLAYCLQEGQGFHQEGDAEIEPLYERVIALLNGASPEGSRLEPNVLANAERMLQAFRTFQARRRKSRG